jgi:hypothetical protein
MGKNKCCFYSSFKKTRYFDVSDINYDSATKSGTCMLKSKHKCLMMVWTLKNYPNESPMPGCLYPVLFSYTIFEKNKCLDSKESMSGQFILEETSGVPPNYNFLGLPFGEYRGLSRDNNCNKSYKLKFSLVDDCMELAIKQNHYD